MLEFIEQSPDGVIYFSFGSTVKMSTIPESVKKSLIKALARIPQRVLLKYEDEMDEKPKNMMTKQWLPQRDILCKYYLIYVIIILWRQLKQSISKINVMSIRLKSRNLVMWGGGGDRQF